MKYFRMIPFVYTIFISSIAAVSLIGTGTSIAEAPSIRETLQRPADPNALINKDRDLTSPAPTVPSDAKTQPDPTTPPAPTAPSDAKRTAQENSSPGTDREMGRESELERKIWSLESVIWKRFYSPVTDLFYDYLTSYESGHELDHLPDPDEVARQYPNIFGYGTGMEDCMISAGVLLSGVLEEYEVTQEASLIEKAEKIFFGIERCATVHGSPGFIARGISPKAPDKVYVNTSRDQVTHAIYSLWEYANSPLCRPEIRLRIQAILEDVAEKMIEEIIPENHYEFLNADGSPSQRGLCKMKEVQTHEAARLVMIYAACWDVSGQEKYYQLWRNGIQDALRDSDGEVQTGTYALLQMQLSLALLKRLEPDQALREKIEQIMTQTALIAQARIRRVESQIRTRDLTVFAPDWRIVGGLVGEYRETWYAIRECGEIAIILLLTDHESLFLGPGQELLTEIIQHIDCQKVSSCGVYDIYAAYWKARRLSKQTPIQ